MKHTFSHLKKAFWLSLWFVLLAFPLVAVRVNTLNQEVEWRFWHVAYLAAAIFLLTLAWQAIALQRKKRQDAALTEDEEEAALVSPQKVALFQRILDEKRLRQRGIWVLSLTAIAFPWVVSSGQDFYHVNVMISALIFVVLALGLNITVGLAGLLDLGYIAFFAVGAYTYALLNTQLGLGFWLCLPLGGLVSMGFAALLGFPVLRLRGDYLAIVTLGFGMITRIVLENWDSLTGGNSGVANIAAPAFPFMTLEGRYRAMFLYYIVLALLTLTILATRRLKNSRIGRAWMALREDEIASVAMGVNMAKTKLSAYVLGAFFAGLVGVVFAAQNTFINPDSFSFMDSVMVLSMVVLGGMGSILGVAIAALTLKVLPEYLRIFAEYRMLIFGGLMVLMMIFRPQGLMSHTRRQYRLPKPKDQ